MLIDPLAGALFGEIVRSGSPVRIALRGELDVAGVVLVEELLARARPARSVVIDCFELRFIDAAGITSLLRAVAVGARVVGVHGPVERTMRVVDVYSRICDAAHDYVVGGCEHLRTERTVA
jgi:anti-anti-sigma factor